MAKVDCNKWRRWKNQRKDWPLTVAANGQWCKRIRGHLHYFGVLDRPEEALRLYLQERDFLLAGQEPPSRYEGLTVAELCDHYLADAQDRVQAGKLSRFTLQGFHRARRCLAAAGLEAYPVDLLKPMDFAKVQRAIETAGFKLRTQRVALLAIRSIFNWGVQMELCQRPKYGPRFVPPTLHEIEAECEAAGHLRFFDRELLLKLLELADERMRLVILMGLNFAFYGQDSEAITLDHLHLDEPIPYHDFPRVKTKQKRMAAIWPETLQAIRAYMANSRRPRSAEERRLIVNQYGQPYAPRNRSLSRTFDALLMRAGEKPAGASLGSLRHVAATVLDLARDQQIIDLIMGHVAGAIAGSRKVSLQRRFYSQLNLGELERLQAAAEVVHRWLYRGELAGVVNTSYQPQSGMPFRIIG